MNRYRASTGAVAAGTWRGWLNIIWCTGLLAGCDHSQVPVGSILSIVPEQRSFVVTAAVDTYGRCVFDTGNYQDLPLVLSLRDAQGAPVNQAGLAVVADYSGNTYPGLEVLQVFDDRNGNGVIDVDSELVSGVNDEAFTTFTERWTGDRHLWLRVNLSCPFTGEVRAFAGPTTIAAQIDVVAGSTQVVNPQWRSEQ